MQHLEFTDEMELTEKLRVWGSAHAAARAAEERAIAQESGAADNELRRNAQRLREHANRLHRAIYAEIGRERPE